MLSKNVIDTILDDGAFYQAEFDFELNEPKTTDQVKDWFVEQYKIGNRDSAFIEFYNLVAFPPVGNGPNLFDLEQINKSKNILKKESLLLIASGDTGSYVYDALSDTVYEYDFMINSDDDLKEEYKPYDYWNSFSKFLDAYYA